MDGPRDRILLSEALYICLSLLSKTLGVGDNRRAGPGKEGSGWLVIEPRLLQLLPACLFADRGRFAQWEYAEGVRRAETFA